MRKIEITKREEEDMELADKMVEIIQDTETGKILFANGVFMADEEIGKKLNKNI